MTAPDALARQIVDPLAAFRANTVPFSVPKYSRPWSSSGEDSARLGSAWDQIVRPSFARMATTRPACPGARSRMTA